MYNGLLNRWLADEGMRVADLIKAVNGVVGAQA
jgi:hypothetical protein